MRFTTRLAAATLAATLAAGSAFAGPTTQPIKPYPLKTCMVSGEDLGDMGDPIVLNYKDREIKFCCKSCVAKFNKDPDKYVQKLDEAEKKPTTKSA